jgi:hypothetical protein
VTLHSTYYYYHTVVLLWYDWHYYGRTCRHIGRLVKTGTDCAPPPTKLPQTCEWYMLHATGSMRERDVVLRWLVVSL